MFDSNTKSRKWGKGNVVEVKLDTLFDQPPPHSLEAEMALLGAMILDPQIIGDVVELIRTPELFYSEAHAAIYEGLVHTYDKHQAGDLVLLAEYLKGKEILADVGGPKYLQKLAQETPGPASAIHFANIVLDKARLRRLIEAGGKMVHEAYTLGQNPQQSVSQIIDAAEASIFAIAEASETSSAESLAVLVDQEYQKLEALQGQGVNGIPTHFADFDEMTSGLQRGEMVIVAARPSMGKTALALNLAEQIAVGGAPYKAKPDAKKYPVGVFSLEMSKAAIALRMLSAKSGISSQDMRSGKLKNSDYERLLDACSQLHEAPIFIDDTPGLTVLGLRTRARRMVHQHGVQVVIVDYLQLMTAPGNAENRQVEVSAISRGIKALARELDVPVICLSQLNRGPEHRGDFRPRMSDLRESGSIEQDADVVALLHREAYYHIGDDEWMQDNEDRINLAELILAKQRNGPTGTVELTWDNHTTRFKDRTSYSSYSDKSVPFDIPDPFSGDQQGARGSTGGVGSSGGGNGGGKDPFRVPVQPFPGQSAPQGPSHPPQQHTRNDTADDYDGDIPI